MSLLDGGTNNGNFWSLPERLPVLVEFDPKTHFVACLKPTSSGLKFHPKRKPKSLKLGMVKEQSRLKFRYLHPMTKPRKFESVNKEELYWTPHEKILWYHQDPSHKLTFIIDRVAEGKYTDGMYFAYPEFIRIYNDCYFITWYGHHLGMRYSSATFV